MSMWIFFTYVNSKDGEVVLTLCKKSKLIIYENIARKNFRRRKNGLLVLMWTHCTKYQIQKKSKSLIITEHIERYRE